jgi:hypothetical protein
MKSCIIYTGKILNWLRPLLRMTYFLNITKNSVVDPDPQGSETF